MDTADQSRSSYWNRRGAEIVQKWHFIFVVLSLISVTACGAAAELSTITPTRVISTATLTHAPDTHTAIPPTATITFSPSDTTTPAEIYPTKTPAPLLPSDLAQIRANNITQLEQLTSLPVKEVYQLAFSPSGNLLATLSRHLEDRIDYLEVWDLTTGEQILLIENLISPRGLYFPAGETTLYVANKLYGLAEGEVISALEVNPFAFSPDGLTFATGDYLGIPEESVIRLIELTTQKEVFSLIYPGMVQTLQFSPDGHFLTGEFQGFPFHVTVWDISKRVVVLDLVDHYSGLTFSPDRKLAASVKKGRVYTYFADQMTYRASFAFLDPSATPDIMDFSLNGDILAIEYWYTIRFIEPNSGVELMNIPDECMVKFSPKGNILVTWCFQEDLKIWGVRQ